MSLSMKRIIMVAGASISFNIGSGFATGQETIQYWVPFGILGLLSILIYTAINTYANNGFIDAGKETGESNPNAIFNYFCGKYIGTFFDWFAVFFCFLSFAVMVAGAGAVLNQQWEIPSVVGSLIIAVLAGITVTFGLHKMLNVLGVIGPVIIIFSLVGSIIGIIFGSTGVSNGIGLATSGKYDLISAGDTWWKACYSYLGFGMMWFAAFFAAIGKTEKNVKDAKLGNILFNILMALMIILAALSLFANLGIVQGTEVPILAFLNHISPVLGMIYSLSIFFAIYTTACPLLWTPVQRLAKDGTRKYKILALVLMAIGTFIGLAVPFSALMNYVYVINGYVGGILILFIIIKRTRIRIAKNKNDSVPPDSMDSAASNL